jgi:hypothetical protein
VAEVEEDLLRTAVSLTSARECQLNGAGISTTVCINVHDWTPS